MNNLSKIQRTSALAFTLICVLAAGLFAFKSFLVSHLPPDLESRRALDAKVTAEQSLSVGEQIYFRVPEQPAVSLAVGTSELFEVLVVTLKASLDPERGATTSIEASVRACPSNASPFSTGFRVSEEKVDEEALASNIERTLCVPVRAGSKFTVHKLLGEWKSADAIELPELENSARILAYEDSQSLPANLVVVALGFCAGVDEGCNSTVSAFASPAAGVEAFLALEEGSPALLKFQAHRKLR